MPHLDIWGTNDAIDNIRRDMLFHSLLPTKACSADVTVVAHTAYKVHFITHIINRQDILLASAAYFAGGETGNHFAPRGSFSC